MCLPQPDPNNPTGVQPPTLTEILLRAAGGALNPQRPIMVPRNAGGMALGLGSRLAGGILGGIGESHAGQRLSPEAQALRVAEAILKEQNKLPDMGQPMGTTLPISQFGAQQGPPIREQDVKGQPQLPAPPPNPFAGMSKQTLAAYLRNPELAPFVSPVAQANIARDVAATEFVRGPQTTFTQAQTAETVAQGQERQERLTETRRQHEADREFRQRAQKFRSQNPNASPSDYAGFIAKTQLELGASDDATKPVINALEAQAQIDYRTQMIALNKQEQGRLAQQHREALDRGDANTARAIVAEEARVIQARIKEYEGRIKTHEKMLVDSSILPKDKIEIRARIETDREELREVERPALKDVQDRLSNLFAGTRAGREVVSRLRPPIEPPEGVNVLTPGRAPRTLEEYKKLEFERLRKKKSQGG